MTTLLTSKSCLDHDPGPRHPERPARLASVLDHLVETGLMDDMTVVEAPVASREDLLGVHPAGYVDALAQAVPAAGQHVRIDPDTVMSAGSWVATQTAAGAVVRAVDLVLDGDDTRAFCAVRPPGHHAEPSVAMGFCLLNGIAVGAVHALANDGVDRVAILDFDVHHGNGTVAAFKSDPRVLVCSSFQHPHYPYRLFDVDAPNIVNTPLPAGTTGRDYRNALERDWLPAVDAFKPDLILVSAGFDAHAADPLGELLLDENDFAWTANLIVDAAARHANGRCVSVLEGGYDLNALNRSVAAYLGAL